MWLSVLGLGIQGWTLWKWDAWKASLQVNPSDGPHPSNCSVVVCCHNEAEQLKRLHEGIQPALDRAAAEGIFAEIIAVNHGSTDSTLQDLLDMARRDGRWKIEDVPRRLPSKKEALERAVRAAQGEVIVALDADCTPRHPSWLVEMTRGASRHWDVHVGLGLPTQDQHNGLLQRMQRLEARRLAQRAVGAVEAGRPYLAFGRNLAFTRAIWDLVGGFSSHKHLLSGDDDLWLQEAVKHGARVKATPSPTAQTTSLWPTSWTAWRRQKTRHFSASRAYPVLLQARLALPALGWALLLAGVVHNGTGTSVGMLLLATIARALTFGLFLKRAGRPALEAWEICLEPLVSAFRAWAWFKGNMSDSTSWK